MNINNLNIPISNLSEDLEFFQNSKIISADSDQNSIHTLYDFGTTIINNEKLFNSINQEINKTTAKVFKGTLEAGNTEITFYNKSIQPDCNVKYYCEIQPFNIIIKDGSITLAFGELEEDLPIVLIVSNFKNGDEDMHHQTQTEQAVGTWVDDKTIYEIVLQTTVPIKTNAFIELFDLDNILDSDIDTVCKLTIFTTVNEMQDNNYRTYTNSDKVSLYYDFTKNKIYGKQTITSDYNNINKHWKSYIILQYTKK